MRMGRFPLLRMVCRPSSQQRKGLIPVIIMVRGDQSAVLNNRYNAANTILGYAVQSNLLKMSGRSDRGVRRARFAVIKAPCPAALVECGFLTNPEEERLLRTEAYRSRVAQGL